MELQDLKLIWTKVVDEEHIKYELDRKKVQEMIHEKSNTILAKVEYRLKYKRWFCGIIGGFTILLSPTYLLLNKDTNPLFGNVLSKVELFSITLLMGLALMFLCIKISLDYKKIVAQKTASENLNTTLNKVSDILKNIMKTTIFLDTIIVPLVTFLILYRILFEESSFVFDSRVLYILLGTAIAFLFIRYVSKRQQEDRFGAFIKNLNECIADMDVLTKS